MTKRSAIRTGSLLAACAMLLPWATATAQTDQWQKVHLDHGITMDVPAVVGNDYKPAATGTQDGDLMFFAVTTNNAGDMNCLLAIVPYSKTMTHVDVIEKLADSRRDGLCTAGDGQTGINVGESKSMSVSGFPAGRCAASYTIARNKQPGQITAMMGVAAPDAFYLLNCTVSADSQDDVKDDWTYRWESVVHHIQDSVQMAGQ